MMDIKRLKSLAGLPVLENVSQTTSTAFENQYTKAIEIIAQSIVVMAQEDSDYEQVDEGLVEDYLADTISEIKQKIESILSQS